MFVCMMISFFVPASLQMVSYLGPFGSVSGPLFTNTPHDIPRSADLSARLTV